MTFFSATNSLTTASGCAINIMLDATQGVTE